MITLVMLRHAMIKNLIVVLQSSSFCMMTELGPYFSLMRSLFSNVLRNVASLSILAFFSAKSASEARGVSVVVLVVGVDLLLEVDGTD